MADPDRRAWAKTVFLMTKLIDPREDEMQTLVQLILWANWPLQCPNRDRQKNRTLQQIQAEDQAQFKNDFNNNW